MNIFASPKKEVFSIEDSNIQVLFPENNKRTNTKVTYRRDGKSVDKVTEYDVNSGQKIRTVNYDYFNDKKIRSVDEYDSETGNKIRSINYVLYKSIDEYDVYTGKKLRTINFNVKDENKISSIQEYDINTGKIITISIYKRDGKTVGIVKNIDPETDKVTTQISNKYDNRDMSQYTRSYENIKTEANQEDISSLIDNLYSNNFKFENI